MTYIYTHITLSCLTHFDPEDGGSITFETSEEFAHMHTMQRSRSKINIHTGIIKDFIFLLNVIGLKRFYGL
jgi:hypothetical protein